MNGDLKGIHQYRRLSENIASAGQPTQAQLKGVAQAGFEVVINLGLSNVDYSLKDEGLLVEFLGLTYEHLPVAWERPTEEDLRRFFDIMAKHEGKRIFIHCAANKRVSVFMALHRIMQKGWSREGALDVMHKVWTPNETWQGFIDNFLSDRTVS